MSEFILALKQMGTPGSIGFLAVCSVAGLLAMRVGPRSRQIARAWLLFLMTSYLIAATPMVAYTLAGRLPAYGPVWQANRPDGSGKEDLVVVLSGDNPLERARQTRRILDTMTPRCVLVSGDPWFVAMVMEAGVSRHNVVADASSETTREQIEQLPVWAATCGARRVILVASDLSMPRIAALVRRVDVPVLLAPSPLDSPPVALGGRRFLPSLRALELSRDALYEHLAFAYYRQHQWIH